MTHLYMPRDARRLCEAPFAEVARVEPLLLVYARVRREAAVLDELLVAHVAREGLFARVGAAVRVQVARLRESPVAFGTLVRLLS